MQLLKNAGKYYANGQLIFVTVVVLGWLMVITPDKAMGRHVLSLAKLRHSHKNVCAVIFQDDNKVCFTNARTFGGDCNH